MTERILALARSISPRTVETFRKRTAAERAAENEAKYGSEPDPEEVCTISDNYRKIEAGFDNGRCATRAGTYRRFKRKEAAKFNN